MLNENLAERLGDMFLAFGQDDHAIKSYELMLSSPSINDNLKCNCSFFIKMLTNLFFTILFKQAISFSA